MFIGANDSLLSIRSDTLRKIFVELRKTEGGNKHALEYARLSRFIKKFGPFDFKKGN